MASNESNFDPQSYEYMAVDANSLPAVQQADILHLSHVYLESVYPHQTAEEYFKASTDVMVSILKPQSLVGNVYYAKQRIVNPLTYLATKDGELRAVLTASDNASSRLPTLLGGFVEQQFKLRSDRFINKRWRKFGWFAISPDLTAPAFDSLTSEDLTPIDVLAMMALSEAEGQPVSAYPRVGENLLKATIASWGMKRDNARATKDVAVFNQEHPITEEPWKGDRGTMVAAIGERHGDLVSLMHKIALDSINRRHQT